MKSLEVQGVWSGWLHDLYLAVDDPTGWILLAYLATRAGRARVASLMGALAAGTVVLSLAQPELARAAVPNQILASLPYYAGLALLVLGHARGDATDRWVALAFMPRALVFAAQPYVPGPDGPWELVLLTAQGTHAVHVYAVTAMGLACLVGAFRMLRTVAPGGPPPGVVVALALVGPLDAWAWKFIGGETLARIVAASFVNFLTLSLVRPFLLYVAFVPTSTMRILGQAVMAAGLGTLTLVAAPLLYLPGPAAAILAFSVGSLALVALEATAARAVTTPVRTRKDARGRAQWEVLLLALRQEDAGRGGPPRASWTQRGLSERTGLDVKRVSEFPRDLHATAAAKLDRHLPGWRTDHRGGEPALVTTHRGAVAGLPGVWVYYRLTPLGERLAEAVAAAPEASPPAHSNGL